MDILKTIDQIEQLIEESFKVPLSDNILINKEELVGLVEAVKESIPDDLKKAKYVNMEKQKIIDDAESEAKLILKEADEKLRLKLSGEEVYKAAKLEAERILVEAKNKYDEKLAEAERLDKELKDGTWQYITELLQKTKKYLTTISVGINTMTDELNDNISDMRDRK